MASNLFLSNNSGLYFLNSLTSILYSFAMSSESDGTKKSKIEFQSYNDI